MPLGRGLLLPQKSPRCCESVAKCRAVYRATLDSDRLRYMDPSHNPYSPGAGVRPRELAGRDHELENFRVLRGRAERSVVGRSIVLTGLRGVGKTVLLNEMAAKATEDGWLVTKVEVDVTGSPSRGFSYQVARSFNRSLREVQGRWKGAGQTFKRALSTFKNFSLTVDPSGALSVGIDVGSDPGRADTGSLEADLEELALDLAVAAAERGVGVALFIDELQDATEEELAAIAATCHQAAQRGARFYVVAAGLPSLPGLLAEARSYSERLFDYRTLGALDGASATRAVVLPAEAEGAAWEPVAAELVVAKSSGYPFFIQEFAKAAWDAARGPTITTADAEEGISIGTAELDTGFFVSRWQRATPMEREYTKAMAIDGDGPSQSGEIVRRLNKKRASLLGPTRAKLISKGLVYAPEHGLIAFTVPGMAPFIARQSS